MKLIEIARISTVNTNNKRDIIRRLMNECDSFKVMTFATATEQFRYFERAGLVKQEDGCITIYHDIED